MIKVHKSDSIVDIIIKIKNSREREIVIEFPFWHPVLHNYTSLRILKAKAERKDLVIVTSDRTAKKIWARLWIKYSLTDNPDLLHYNYTFFEYFLYTFKSYFREIRDIFLQKNNDNIISKYRERYWDSKIWYFVSILLISVLLLVFVFYFAVNKTYIEITPKIEVKTSWKNFVFTESNSENVILDDNKISLRRIEKEIFIDSSFWASGIAENSVTSSRWRVTLFNEFVEEMELINNTRIQTEDWIVFLLDWNAVIPGSSVSSTGAVIPWKVEIYAESRLRDSEGEIIWERWNIESWVEMFLPGLTEDRDKIYAISSWKFDGWEDNNVKIITQEDVENAKQILRWKLETQAYEQIKNDLAVSNQTNNVRYEIFPIDWITKYSNFEIIWEEQVNIWEESEGFQLWWSIKITSFSYNKEMLMTKLRQTVTNQTLEKVEKLLQINENSLRIVSEPISKSENPFSVKSTAMIEAYFIHNFLWENNNYVDRLKSVVTWISRDEAENILINTGKISNVDISIRPFFLNTVSKIKDNIVLQIKEN